MSYTLMSLLPETHTDLLNFETLCRMGEEKNDHRDEYRRPQKMRKLSEQDDESTAVSVSAELCSEDLIEFLKHLQDASGDNESLEGLDLSNLLMGSEEPEYCKCRVCFLRIDAGVYPMHSLLMENDDEAEMLANQEEGSADSLGEE